MAVTAACMLTSRSLFQQVGGFDAETFGVAYNDADYGFRLHAAGYRNLYCPEAELYHFEGRTRPKTDDPREVQALRQRYGFASDPYHNPNLSLDGEHFDVAARRLPMRADRAVKVGVITHNLRREGAPKTLCDLIVGLKMAGTIDPVVFAPALGPLASVYDDAGIDVVLVGEPSPGDGLPGFLATQSILATELRKAEVEVVVANTLTTSHGILAASQANLPSIWCQHESEHWASYFDALAPEVRPHAYSAFARPYAITYVAGATRRAWQPVQTRHNAVTIRHGVPESVLAAETAMWKRAEARRRLGLTSADFAIILPGTVCERKGQEDAVAALALLPPALMGRLRLFIAGAMVDRLYATRLGQSIYQSSPQMAARIEMVGPVDDMNLYYAAADLLLCTSRIESAPRVLVEAMAFELPIVTTPVFGIPEMVDEGVNAIFYPAGDAQALADCISALVDAPERRAAMAAASHAVLGSRPDFDDMISQYSKLIREAVLTGSPRDTAEMMP